MISYLQAENISKSFGDRRIFENISLFINEGDKIAIIARNGVGKTTLLNILVKNDSPDDGLITYKNDLRIGYLPQNPPYNKNQTVLEYVFHSSNEVIQTIKDYELALVSGNNEKLPQIMAKMDALSAWDYETNVKQILSKLKIEQFNQQIGELSGGQFKRVSLATALIDDPDLLILDEPTNHLDVEMIEWLEEFLNKSKLTLLLVTHDRYFLDRVCNRIVEMDNNQMYNYEGNYSYYLEKRQERLENMTAQIEKAKNLYRKELDWMRRQPQARAGKAKYRIDSFYETKEKAHQKMDDSNLEMDFEMTRLGNKIIDIYNISKQFDEKVLFREFSYKFAKGEKVGLIGKNGTGKSTFLNIITGNLDSDSGKLEVGTTVKIGYYKQEGIQFDENEKMIDVIKNISEHISLTKDRSMSAAQYLEYFLFSKDSHYSQVAKLSGGERRRLYLMTVLMQKPNFLILDEPTNDLDIMTLNVLEDYLQHFQGSVLIVSHDRFFMDKVVDHLFVFNDSPTIQDFPGSYTLYREKQKMEETKAIKNTKPETIKKERPKQQLKVSYKEKREFELLTEELDQLNTEKAELETLVNSGTLETNDLIAKAERIGKIIELLEEKEMRWLELSEKIEG